MVQPGVYRLRNVKSGTYLDESNKDQGTVHGWDSRPDNDNQKWYIQPSGNGFSIKNVKHGRYLSVPRPDNNTNLEATNNATTWTFKDQGRGQVIGLEGTNQVADLDEGNSENGTRVSVWHYTGAHQQLWELEQVGGGSYGGDYSAGQQQPQQPQQPQQQYRGAIQPGTYRVHNIYTGTALDLAGGSSNDGTPVIAWSVGNGANQAWSFEPGSNGYRIKNNASGTYLGYGGENAGDLLQGHGQPVEWTVSQADKGYQIHPANNQGLVVDLAEGKKDDGAKICLWNNNNQDNQKWNIQNA